MSMFARSGRSLAAQTPATRAQLASHSWILFQGHFDLRQHLHDFFRRDGLPPPAVAVDSRSFATGLAITGQGDHLLCLAAALGREASA